MSDEKKFKYVARRDLELFPEKPEKARLNSVTDFIGKLLFKNPVATFGAIIILIVFPLATYITIRSEQMLLSSEALGSNLQITSPSPEVLKSGDDINLSFDASSLNTSNLTLSTISQSAWLSPSDPIYSSSEDETKDFGLISFSGKVPSETSEDILVLAKAEKEDDYVLCNGCDSESKYVYSLSGMKLTDRDCSKNSVWARNPLSSQTCVEFNSSCLVPSDWNYYESTEECSKAVNPPQISEITDEMTIYFEKGCDNEYVSETYDFVQDISATDADGDIVRFSITTSESALKIEQSDISELVSEIYENKNLKFSDFVYEAKIKGTISVAKSGTPLLITINACDYDGNCSSKNLIINILEKFNCEKTISELAVSNAYINITYPEAESEFSGINNIIYRLAGFTEYHVSVNLYDSSCLNQITNIALYEKLVVEDKGYATSFDSTKYPDGEYCIGVLLDTPPEPVWEHSDFIKFNIKNVNHAPEITSTPGKVEIKTGETYEYVITAVDSDQDTLTYDLEGAPDWLILEGTKISGTTNVFGQYSYQIIVQDTKGAYDTQLVGINVVPPSDMVSQIVLTYPKENSILSGTDNLLGFNVSDGNGVKEIRLYYSTDGKEWTLIGIYPANTTSVNWDVSGLTNGKYYLKFVVVDNSELKVETSKISSAFYIENDTDKPNGQDDDSEDLSVPSIDNLYPKKDSNVETRRPLISATFAPSQNAQIESENVEIKLDDNDINSNCDIQKDNFKCNFSSDLELGRHKVNVKISDSKGKTASTEWFFTIVEVTQTTEVEEETDGVEYIKIPIINLEMDKSVFSVIAALCCASLLLILLPWLLINLWNRKTTKNDYASAPQAPEPFIETEETADTYKSPTYSEDNLPKETSVYNPPSYPDLEENPDLADDVFSEKPLPKAEENKPSDVYGVKAPTSETPEAKDPSAPYSPDNNP